MERHSILVEVVGTTYCVVDVELSLWLVCVRVDGDEAREKCGSETEARTIEARLPLH